MTILQVRWVSHCNAHGTHKKVARMTTNQERETQKHTVFYRRNTPACFNPCLTPCTTVSFPETHLTTNRVFIWWSQLHVCLCHLRSYAYLGFRSDRAIIHSKLSVVAIFCMVVPRRQLISPKKPLKTRFR